MEEEGLILPPTDMDCSLIALTTYWSKSPAKQECQIRESLVKFVLSTTLHPGCLKEPDGDPIELFIPCYPL